MSSKLEEQFAFQITALRLSAPVREHKFHPTRRWRFDFAWPAQRLAVEIEGGIWTGGRHTRGAGFESDCEKYATAVLEGWRVIRVTGKQVLSGDAVRWVEAALSVSLSTVPASLSALWAWCDERRNAPTVTTLGMVQAKIEELRKGGR